MRPKFAPLLLLLTSCYAQARIEFPPLSEDTQSLLLQDPEGYLWIFDADSPSGLYLEEPLGLRLDHLRESISELGVVEGPIGRRLEVNPGNGPSPTLIKSYVYGESWGESDSRIETNGLLKLKACRDPYRGTFDVVAPHPPACPTWSTSTENGCEAPVLAACPSGTARFSRSGPCRPLAVDCPAGPWPQLPDNSAHVLAGAGLGGDGTAQRPFATIAEAIQAGARIIGLSAGLHTFSAIPAGVTVIGLCPGATQLLGAGMIEGRVERVTLPSTITSSSAWFDQVIGGVLRIEGSVTSSRSVWSGLEQYSSSRGVFDQTQLSGGTQVNCATGEMYFRELRASDANFATSNCSVTFDGVAGSVHLGGGGAIQVSDADLSDADFAAQQVELRSSRLGQLTLYADVGGLLESCWIEELARLSAETLTLERSTITALDYRGYIAADRLFLVDLHFSSGDLAVTIDLDADVELELHRATSSARLSVVTPLLRATDLLSAPTIGPGQPAAGGTLALQVDDGIIGRVSVVSPDRSDRFLGGFAITWTGARLDLHDVQIAGFGTAIRVSAFSDFALTVDRFRFDTGPEPIAGITTADRQDQIRLRNGEAPATSSSPGFCAPLVSLEQVDPALCNALQYCP